MANAYDNYVSFNGFEVDHVTAVDLEINKFVQDSVKFWDQFYKAVPYVKGHKTFEHRKHIRPETTYKYASSLKLSEGVGTKSESIKVVKWSDTFDDYGSNIPYTKEGLRDNYDDTLSLIKDQFKYEAVEVPEKIKAEKMCSSTFQVTAESTVKATLDKAGVILVKKKNKPFDGTKFVAIVTPEIMAKLTAELTALGAALPDATKHEVICEGAVKTYGRFNIVECADDAMYGASGVNKIVIISKTRDNELPGAKMDPEISVFDNGLGFGLIQSADDATKMVADTNKRVGSVAMNIDHLGAAIQADLGHLVCDFTISDDYSASATPSGDPNGNVVSGNAPTSESVTR